MPKKTKHSITEALEVHEIDLWGHKYRSKLLTRSGQERLDELMEVVQESDEEETDEMIHSLAEVLALLVEPVGDDEHPDVVELIDQKWGSDDLPFANLLRLAYGLAQAQRPM